MLTLPVRTLHTSQCHFTEIIYGKTYIWDMHFHFDINRGIVRNKMH